MFFNFDVGEYLDQEARMMHTSYNPRSLERLATSKVVAMLLARHCTQFGLNDIADLFARYQPGRSTYPLEPDPIRRPEMYITITPTGYTSYVSDSFNNQSIDISELGMLERSEVISIIEFYNMRRGATTTSQPDFLSGCKVVTTKYDDKDADSTTDPTALFLQYVDTGRRSEMPPYSNEAIHNAYTTYDDYVRARALYTNRDRGDLHDVTFTTT